MQSYMAYLAQKSGYREEDAAFGSETEAIGPGTIYGDWLGMQDTDSAFLSALWYGADALTMQKIASALNLEKDEETYHRLWQAIRSYVQQNLPKRTLTQTEMVFLLHYGFLDEKQQESTCVALKQSIEEQEYRLMTGFAGTPILLQTLTDFGMADTAYHILLNEENPSWLYSVNQGATSIWERYDSYTLEKGFADAAMNSFDHFNEGSVAQWMYESMLGIKVDFSDEIEITIAPVLPENDIAVHEIAGNYDSPLGRIAVKWSKTDEGSASFTVEIPTGGQAKVMLPLSGEKERILTGGIYYFEGKLEQ